MAHIPLIHGPDGAKLSKRHGALGVDAYRAMGYLPEAMRNYLARLGWSHGDDEIFSIEQMVAGSISPRSANRRRGSTSPSSRTSTATTSGNRDAELMTRLRGCCRISPMVRRSPQKFTPEFKARLRAALPGLKERAKNLANSSRAPASCSPSGRSRSTTRPRRCSIPRPARSSPMRRTSAGSNHGPRRRRRRPCGPSPSARGSSSARSPSLCAPR